MSSVLSATSVLNSFLSSPMSTSTYHAPPYPPIPLPPPCIEPPLLPFRLSQTPSIQNHHWFEVLHRASHPRRTSRAAHRSQDRHPRRAQGQPRRHAPCPQSPRSRPTRPLRRIHRHRPHCRPE